ncbi:MAG: hypothetical protein NC038_03480 [Paludibacter sp.]|nr:hypothetical protein [Bacteroidales bacterium]MCM1069068.1 hypothetical protein [Prevotella sp.]MCM1353507.1 hypothetical protein [Bacteroides sp.]MCM1442668.1 hypothetical protein [Muribaculum sp.]MCM1481696.1 hypothetical protein [Paludibacter sp.]
MHLTLYYSLPPFLQILMQLFVIGTMLFLLYKYRKADLLGSCLILLCYPAPFIFLGKNVENAYKVLMLLLVTYMFVQQKAWKVYQTGDNWLSAAFILFSVQFFFSVFLYSSNSLTIIFSQYARYVEVFLLYFILKSAVFVRERKEELLRLFYDIMLMQILISVFKWFLFRHQVESLVGSFSIIGGAVGTTIPILGFIILWCYRKGNFSWKDWLYITGLLFVGFSTGKRAVMFILPLVIAAFMIYVKGMRLNRYVGLALCCVPLLFYVGVRLTPSLNPDNVVWGRFDLDHVFNYAETYQFGEDGLHGQNALLQQQVGYAGGTYNYGNKIEAEGRGGATIALLKLIFSSRPLTDQDLWGIGFKSMYGIDYATFDQLPLTIHLNHKGSATGIFQSYITTGVLGIICTVFFCFLPFFYCKPRRLRLTLLGIAVWEYFLYTGILFRTPAFMAIIIFVIFYANYAYYQAKGTMQTTSS